MGPLAIFLGIALGSAVSLLAGLGMTTAVFFLLPEFRELLQAEQRPLLIALIWSAYLTALSSAAFIGELRTCRWRRPTQIALALSIAAMAWVYWPR